MPAVAISASEPASKKPANASRSTLATPNTPNPARIARSTPTSTFWKVAVFFAPRMLSRPKSSAKPTAMIFMTAGVGSK